MSGFDTATSSGGEEGGGEWVIPGDLVGSLDQLQLGEGVYASDGGGIFASIMGRRTLRIAEVAGEKSTVFVVGSNKLSESILNVGDRITCRVVKLSAQQAFTEIIAIGDTILKYYPKGVIRKENARASDIDSIIMTELFRPGDIVRAIVSAEGDSKYYFLSTADADLGVQYAKSLSSGQLMSAVDHQTMEDPITKEIEHRKVAILPSSL